MATCWEDGPEQDGHGTTCLLEDGHEGSHEFSRDDESMITFDPIEEKGILQDFGGTRIVYLYDSDKEREEAWNGYTPIGISKYGWKKVKVKVEDEP